MIYSRISKFSFSTKIVCKWFLKYSIFTNALCLKRKNFFQILRLARFEPTTYSRRSSRYRSNHWARKLVLMWESNLCGYSKPKIDHFWMVFKAKKGEKRSRHWYRVFNWCVEQCLEAVAKQILPNRTRYDVTGKARQEFSSKIVHFLWFQNISSNLHSGFIVHN